MDDPLAYVTDADMADLLALFKPGRTYPAAEIYRRYQELMAGQGRPAAHPTSLGHALTRAGCTRQRIRRATGPRKARTFSETAAWTLVGQIDRADMIDPIGVLVRDLGPGLHPEDDIYVRYLRLPLKGDAMTRRSLMTRMTQRGYTRLMHKREFVRDIYPKNGEDWV